MNKDCIQCKHYVRLSLGDVMFQDRSRHECRKFCWYEHNNITGNDICYGERDCQDERRPLTFFTAFFVRKGPRCGVEGSMWEQK